MKRTPLRRKTPLKSGGGLKHKASMKSGGYVVTKRKPLKQQSAKKRAENNVRREVLRQLVDERGTGCEARIEDVCTGQAVDGHEVLTRGRGGSAVDPANILLVCRACHDWIGANPAEAKRRGLLKSAGDA